jgi:hypothetical protein
VRSTRAIGQICAALLRHVNDATSGNDPGALWNIWDLVVPLLGAFPHEQRLGFSAERLVVKMQRLNPLGAAAMILEGLDFGWAPRSSTNVFTWTEAQGAARSYEDLRLVTDFAVSILNRGAIDPSDVSVVQRMNVYLACTTDPRPAHQRIGPYYPREKTIVDVACRAVFGVQAADAAVRAGVPFIGETTYGRMDCSIRGLVSVGAALALECARAEGRITPSDFESARKQLSLNFDWVAPEFETNKLLEYRKLSEWLLLESGQLALRCFTEPPSNVQEARIALRYHIEGRTLSNMLLALELADISHDEARCVGVAQLLWASLQVRDLARGICTDAVHAAFRWINRDGIDQATQGQAILLGLSQALYKIGDVELLGRLADRLLEYLEADPSIETTVSSYLEAMGDRVDELVAEAEGRKKVVAPKNQPQTRTKKLQLPVGNPDSTWFSDLVKDALIRQDNDGRRRFH